MNNLPDLPKRNKTKEMDFGVWLKNYTEKNPHLVSTGLELKQTEKDTIPFSAVTPQQIAFGIGAKSSKGVWIRVQGLNGEQDYVFLVNAQSYVVIRYPKLVCWIDIEDLIKERDTSSKKSLSSFRAREIAVHSINL